VATTNDITGDSIQTKVSSEAYRSNYDAIFRKFERHDYEDVLKSNQQKSNVKELQNDTDDSH
jgi:hypothetical protein